jgi:REP element-mobilizing transposase RayT
MSRSPRIEHPGGFFHIGTRSIYENACFRAIDDRLDFLDIFSTVVETYGWSCKSYCLMGSHYHLVVQTPTPNLSNGIQLLNGKYAQRFNWRHGRHGHLFGGRFWSRHLETDGHLFAALRYVARNPVAAGICEKPADWRWSSFRAIAGLDRPPGFLDLDSVLSLFNLRRQAARAEYVRLVQDSMYQDMCDRADLVRIDGV